MAYTPISSQAKLLLIHLISLLPTVTHDRPETFTGFRQVHLALGLEMESVDWAESLKIQGLVELASWLKTNELPALTGIVVNQTSFLVGPGFFKINDRPPLDIPWWLGEVFRAQQHDWKTVLEAI